MVETENRKQRLVEYEKPIKNLKLQNNESLRKLKKIKRICIRKVQKRNSNKKIIKKEKRPALRVPCGGGGVGDRWRRTSFLC